MTQVLIHSQPVRQTTATLYLSDCLKVMPMLKEGSVSMCFADLPYGVVQRTWDVRLDLSAFWIALKCILLPESVVVATATQPFATDLISSNRKHFRYDLVWAKKRVTGFLNANRMPLRNHESILLFYKKLRSYNPQKTQGLPWKKRRAKAGDLNYGAVKSNDHVQLSDGNRYPTSIVNVPSGNAKSQHPTQKPVALLQWIIATYTNPGDTVLDPVFGSNTTGVACARLGRNYIGIEKDPTYFAAGTERLNRERAILGLTPAVCAAPPAQTHPQT